MTSMALSKGRMFSDFDNYKNEEWLRRRKLRIEQVRKQSKEIAKALRQKVENEEKIRAKVFQKIEEAKFKCWRAEKLDEMERKLRCALEEFGLGHKLAELDHDNNKIIEIKNKINIQKAEERGLIAKQEESKKRIKEKAKKDSPIQRKKMTRKIEDLRSALVRSISVHKPLLQIGNDENDLHLHNKPVSVTSKKEINFGVNQEMATSADKKINSFLLDEPVLEKPSLPQPYISDNISAKTLTPKKSDLIWINLNDIQDSSRTLEKKSQNSNNTLSSRISTHDNIKPVEFYDYQSRYSCKTFREHTNLVEKIDSDVENDATEELKNKEKIENLEMEKKMKMKSRTEKRGQEALRKEKIKRDYNDLITKLEDLNKKEKLAKANLPSSTAVLYMTDDRILEKAKAKQRIMNTKFENIYYNATAEMPEEKPSVEIDEKPNFEESDDDKNFEEKTLLELSLSPSKLKHNTPISLSETSTSKSSTKTSPIQSVIPIKKRKKKLKNKLLVDIDKALNKGRKLRETIFHNWKEENFELEKENIEQVEKESNEKLPMYESKTNFQAFERKGNEFREAIDKEAQTDEFYSTKNLCDKVEASNVKLVDFAAQAGCDTSLSNASTSTSYKSPPSEISCDSFYPLLNRLENLDESEDYLHLKSDPKLRRKVEKMLRDLLCEVKYDESICDSQLKYYIKKLLNMSRECVANLSISSSTHDSTINPSDRDFQCFHKDYQSENDFVFFEKNQAKSGDQELCEIHKDFSCNEAVKNWKSILGQKLSPEDETQFRHSDPVLSVEEMKFGTEREEKFALRNGGSEVLENRDYEMVESEKCETLEKNKFGSNLDLITEKCSKRISELTDLLNKVRRDKELLLESASDTSGSILSLQFRNLEDDEPEIKKYESHSRNYVNRSNFNSRAIDDIITFRNDTPSSFKEKNSAIAVGIKDLPREDGDASMASTETLPDVMNELLNKKIITSPFKWCEGDTSKELEMSTDYPLKSASIETVIGDFRKKILKMKPFSFPSADAIRNSSICAHYKDDVVEYAEQLSDAEENSEIFSSQDTEELSVSAQNSTPESLDLAFKNLGLNWAKSFLKKIEKTKAMSSSTYSDENKIFE